MNKHGVSSGKLRMLACPWCMASRPLYGGTVRDRRTGVIIPCPVCCRFKKTGEDVYELIVGNGIVPVTQTCRACNGTKEVPNGKGWSAMQWRTCEVCR